MSEVVDAFGLGALAAVSLPLGAFTVRAWKPTDFVLGLLTAFGAGALLSAVTIGIVAETVGDDTFAWLAGGAVAGGLAFEALDRLIDARGGFLRKASTTITYLHEHDVNRIRRRLRRLERIDLFRDLPARELDTIAREFEQAELEAGETLYREGDPCDHLNLVASGRMVLQEPGREIDVTENQAFGHEAFFTGTRHGSTAVAATDVVVLRIDRDRFEDLLVRCPVLARRVRRLLLGGGLHRLQDFDQGEVAAWRARIDEGAEALPRMEPPPQRRTPDPELLEEIGRIPLFAGLDEAGRHRIAEHMFPKSFDRGHVFFRAGEPSTRLHLIAEGEASLVDEHAGTRGAATVAEGEALGDRSFSTGSRHSQTAVAATSGTVWVLRRSALDRLVREDADIRSALARYLHGSQIRDYLEHQQGYEPGAAQGWVRAATRHLRAGSLPDPARRSITHGAALAIWLGLMLDGIPESFVVGATADTIRVSLIVGLFISNYPESLSSTVGMREQGFHWSRIAVMWVSIMVLSAVGAAFGAVVFEEASTEAFAVLEGLAAGTMLSVIAETMLPEALARSGGLVGLAALGGFLVTTLVGVI